MVEVEFVDGGGAQGVGLLAEQEGEGHGAGGEEMEAWRAVLLHQGQGSADQGIHQPVGVGAIADGADSRFGQFQMKLMADR